MHTLDCRGRSWPEVGSMLVKRFNEFAVGERLEAYTDVYPTDLKEWLLEAGIRHGATHSPDGAWRLSIVRGMAPAQGSLPVRGVHHILAHDDGSVWTCQRATLVARIDGNIGRVCSVAAVARRGSHMALDAEANRLFVADPEANQVIALRADDLSIEQRWDAPGEPQLPLVSPDGIVCVTGSKTSTLTLARPTDSAFVAETIEVGECPHDPLLSHDGKHIFVPCMGTSDLVKVRLGDGRITGRCKVGDGPAHLARQPKSDRFYVANSWDGTVTCMSDDGEFIASAPSGGWAHAIAITPDGAWVWVANFLDDTVAVFKADTLGRVGLLATDPYPHGLDISPDGRFAVVTGFASKHLRVFDAASRRLLARVEIGLGGSHTAFANDSAIALVTCSVDDYVARINLTSHVLTNTISIHQ